MTTLPNDTPSMNAPEGQIRRDAAGHEVYPGGILDGGTVLSQAERQAMLWRTANPDDPATRRPPRDARGLRPGPDFRGAPGRVAIVQGQVYLVGVILILQLFLVTTALFELLSGHTDLLWWIAGATFVAFLVALLIARWPRSRVHGF